MQLYFFIMLNKRVFSLFALFSILLVGCNDPIKQNYLDRKSKIENFLSYDDTPRYYYEKKDGWRRQPDSFNDESNFVLNAIKSNVPQEVSFEECKKSCENRVIDDINYIMVSYIGVAMAPRYAFTLLSNYITCEVEVVETTYISQSSRRYYLLDENVGKQIYDFVRKQMQNP